MSLDFPVEVVIALVLLATCWPLAGNRFFNAIEEFGKRLAKRKTRAIISLAGAEILFRLALLPIAPVPIPEFHDEFSYLVQADTFVHGRLTNPPHPMWVYFETMHVNQLPTYMSKYPPAQGMALVVGQILGHPWTGCLLEMAAMMAALLWALQGWLPPDWALLGGVLALLRLGLFGYWINSYWGGAMAATGGALVIGALPRLVRSWSSRDAVILGSGLAILANSRPFEGLVFSMPVLVALLFCFFWRRSIPWRQALRRFAIPFGSVILICGTFMAYYNWRGTGNPLLFPYTVNDRTYQTATPALLWQKPEPAPAYANPQFQTFYNGWNHETWQIGRATSFKKAAHLLDRDTGQLIYFFLRPELCLPFLLFLWNFRDRRVRFLVLQVAICLAGFVLAAWFFPHYAAPLVATIFTLTIQGFRHLRKLKFLGRPVGLGISRALVVSALLLAPFHQIGLRKPGLFTRERVATQLKAMKGKHLVIVRYSPQHNPHEEWVYNRADIDGSQVVWARDIPGVDLAPLIHYFSGRSVWIVDADNRAPELRPYTPALAREPAILKR
jgi:hypothetical protein